MNYGSVSSYNGTERIFAVTVKNLRENLNLVLFWRLWAEIE